MLPLCAVFLCSLFRLWRGGGERSFAPLIQQSSRCPRDEVQPQSESNTNGLLVFLLLQISCMNDDGGSTSEESSTSGYSGLAVDYCPTVEFT